MRLVVAGRQFELTHDSDVLASAATLVFNGFSAGSGPRDWLLRFHRGAEAPAQEMSYTCTRVADARFDFVSPGAFAGWIDVGAREAEIVLEAPIAYGLAQRNVLRFALILELQLCGGLVLHAASRVFRGGAYAFFGRSEIGKSTLSRAFPARDFLGDELCFIEPDGRIERTPFFGEVPAPDGALSAPLAMLVALAQAPHVELTPLTLNDATRALLTTTVHLCHDPTLTRALVDRAVGLCERVPVIRAAVPRFAPGALEPVMAELDLLRTRALAALRHKA